MVKKWSSRSNLGGVPGRSSGGVRQLRGPESDPLKNTPSLFVHVTLDGVVFVLFRTCGEGVAAVSRGGSIAVLAAALTTLL